MKKYKGKCPYTPGICACDILDCPDNHLGVCFKVCSANHSRATVTNKPKTNFENLKKKSLDEMAEFIQGDCERCVFEFGDSSCLSLDCHEGAKRWLESEV